MNLIVASKDNQLNLALNFWFNTQPGIWVTGIASDAQGLLALTKATRPHLILLDEQLPGQEVSDFIVSLYAALPSVKVVLISNDLNFCKHGLTRKTDAVISKNDPPGQLLQVFQHLGWLSTPPKSNFDLS
ncbi:MAG: response regulator transcription factor [Chloroflexi bacterium]|nr:response regulator transcription factor [Chloroflexota bacterium]